MLGYYVGILCWDIMLGYYVGILCWDIMLGYYVGILCPPQVIALFSYINVLFIRYRRI